MRFTSVASLWHGIEHEYSETLYMLNNDDPQAAAKARYWPLLHYYQTIENAKAKVERIKKAQK